MMDIINYHKPVLLQEAIQGLDIKPGGVYVDATFGGGGHAREILEHLGPDGRLYAFDVDPDAKRNVMQDSRIIFIRSNFRWLSRMLKMENVMSIDGLLADLGVSSYQLDTESRGFSTRYDTELDMRMNTLSEKTAAHIVAGYAEADLCRIFSTYSQLSNSRSLAREIVRRRESEPIVTTAQLKSVVMSLSRGVKNMNKHLAKVFQALRIEVNEELQALRELLEQAKTLVCVGGRIAIISYHSEEDRLVKNFIHKGTFHSGAPAKDIYGKEIEPKAFRPLNKKPLIPSQEEIRGNSRARSAKLRVGVKII